MPRIAGNLADVAAIDLSFHVERLQRHMAPVVAAVAAAEHARARDGKHGTWPPATGKDAVHVDHIVVNVLAVAQVFPMLTAVGRTDRAADFDRAI